MDKPHNIHDSIQKLSTILHSQICEADAQIKSLEQNVQLLSRGQVVSDTTELEDDIPSDDEDIFIYELEKSRLQLVMDIQEENYISQKLKEMVGECETLMSSVKRYYNSFHKSRLQETLGYEVKEFDGTALEQIKNLLRVNTSRLEASQSALYNNAMKVLEVIESEETHLLAPKSQEALLKVIQQLNKKFNDLTEKGV
ncbi:hypothetical protein METBIDRAFT_10642 [Metschnikowia bicuspidata var. bicuspidata NRRL YB-4993]|uniref:Uncharacterized protein n=1 Tax=Metschnikowia bicuspidata var. bicuspidata NRRL YB-4993 TaxID=869754 RepID=A0A1A0HKJ0_9ASCO|nr:hypothetical protein METBIDRAFT_10642 [Metschnikowia bicuspidata var. bicuspidata NRRL YB-4993]OBA24506.1 hypothetical protein METBIDRAFT_10642 [Metschnikowia bicuspidata var. bicuspidata NRRL YB-4993]